MNNMLKVRFELIHEGSVASVTLHDGKGNVLDSIMMSELDKLFRSFSDMKDLKAIIISGAGKHFSFGASVEEHRAELAGDMLASFHNLFYLLCDLSIPAIALVSGQCLGGGMELALMCNLIFADKSARFGQPEIQLGVFAPPASVILQEKTGLARAEEILLTGRSFEAEEAMAIGMVNRVFEDKEQLESGAREFIVKHILPKSASSLKYAVRAGRQGLISAIKTKLPVLEKMYVEELMKTYDANEGINSFLEKRMPVWENQ